MAALQECLKENKGDREKVGACWFAAAAAAAAAACGACCCMLLLPAAADHHHHLPVRLESHYVIDATFHHLSPTPVATAQCLEEISAFQRACGQATKQPAAPVTKH